MQENAKLIWIGDGEMKPELEVSIDSMGLQNECILLGKKSDVENWYAAMDLFFLPSKFEGLGIVF
ncbi:MAG: glycosyltransferase [Agathobacter rectalis]